MPTKVSAVLVIDMPIGNTELCQVMASAWHIPMIYRFSIQLEMDD